MRRQNLFFWCNMAEGRATNNLAICLEYVISESGPHICRRTEPLAKKKLGIGEAGVLITEHHPVIPRKLAYVADVSSVPFHKGLRNFALQLINVVGSTRPNSSFKLKTETP